MDGYDVAICESCGAGFADDIPAQAVFDAYYRDLSKYEDAGTGGNEPAPVEQRFRDIAGLLAGRGDQTKWGRRERKRAADSAA